MTIIAVQGQRGQGMSYRQTVIASRMGLKPDDIYDQQKAPPKGELPWLFSIDWDAPREWINLCIKLHNIEAMGGKVTSSHG